MIPIRDTAPCYSKPWVTWTLMAVCIIVFLGMRLLPEQLQYQLTYAFGMVPLRYSNPLWAANFGFYPDYYFSFISNLFLHGSWLHIAVNMLFLWIFADNVEDRMGRFRFIVFYLTCGALATFLQFYNDPSLPYPVIGASGAIAGVLGAYFVLYPYERIIVWLPVFFYSWVFHVPAIAFLGLWVIVQLHNATTAAFLGEAVDVAWWAHLGGFLAGYCLCRFFVKSETSQLQ